MGVPGAKMLFQKKRPGVVFTRPFLKIQKNLPKISDQANGVLPGSATGGVGSFWLSNAKVPGAKTSLELSACSQVIRLPV